MKKEKKGEKRKLTRRTLHYYWQATKKHKGLFVTGILVTPIVVASRTVMVPYFTADIIGKVSAGIDPVAEWSAFMPSIIGLLACYLLGSELLGHIRIWAVWKLELKVAYDLATYCFDKVCTQSMRFHSNRFSGSLVSQTNKFVGGYERLFDTLIFSVLWLGISVVASVAILAVRAPLFAIILVAVVLLYTTVATLSYKKVGKLSAKYASAETKQTGQLADSMSNILAVKSYGRESHEKRRYAGFSNATFDAGMNQMRAVIVREICDDGFVQRTIHILVEPPGKMVVMIVRNNRKVEQRRQLHGPTMTEIDGKDSLSRLDDNPHVVDVPDGRASTDFRIPDFANHDIHGGIQPRQRRMLRQNRADIALGV